MAHRYGLPITVKRAADGTPAALTWRGQTYPVCEVLGTWHLMDRWWVTGVAQALGQEPRAASDRRYYRLLLSEHQVFEIYHDTSSGDWVLDVIQD